MVDYDGFDVCLCECFDLLYDQWFVVGFEQWFWVGVGQWVYLFVVFGGEDYCCGQGSVYV